ncbi:Protein of unknown function [Gryllus bimaculatus]|nr:Protein of unknown function [Gryllus bimaculatus]
MKKCSSIQTVSISMLLRYSHHQIFVFIGVWFVTCCSHLVTEARGPLAWSLGGEPCAPSRCGGHVEHRRALLMRPALKRNLLFNPGRRGQFPCVARGGAGRARAVTAASARPICMQALPPPLPGYPTPAAVRPASPTANSTHAKPNGNAWDLCIPIGSAVGGPVAHCRRCLGRAARPEPEHMGASAQKAPAECVRVIRARPLPLPVITRRMLYCDTRSCSDISQPAQKSVSGCAAPPKRWLEVRTAPSEAGRGSKAAVGEQGRAGQGRVLPEEPGPNYS